MYNEAFENPEYHHAETLEIDRRRNYQVGTSFHHNPYNVSPYHTYEDFNEGEESELNSAVIIPMDSMRIQCGADYRPRVLAMETPGSNPYGNAHINPSFEYEPEFEYEPGATTNNDFQSHYIHRSFEALDGVSLDQRCNRREVGVVFMTPSSLLQLDPGYNEEKQKQEEELISSLAVMSTQERMKTIQKIPKTIQQKREIRNNALLEKTKKSPSKDAHINCCTQCFYNTVLTFRQFKIYVRECFQVFKLWQKTLKVIGGKFGTSVRSYFAFLTWLLMFNVFSFLVNFSFITIPQLIEAKPNTLSFTGLEFFTGAGYFDETVLYYGFYTNATITKNQSIAPYYMQLAYIFTIGIYFIICFLCLIYSMAKSFRENFVSSLMYSGNAARLLCIWDFNIMNEKAVKMKQRNLSTQIKENLSEAKTEAFKLSACQRTARICIHLAAWTVSTGVAGGTCAAIYFFSLNNLDYFLQGDKAELNNQAVTLIFPVVVNLLNHTVPFFYSFFGFVEKFTHPRHQLYTAIIRNVILKISIIAMLCFYWLSIVAVSETECWETLVGQDIYRLIVADFICCLLGSFFGEFIRRIIGTKCCKTLGVPEFDIARNVLDLIYAQTLAWIGVFFSPMLPAIQMISFFIIFYVKKVSLMMNCQPPSKAWRASQMNTVFIFLLFFPSLTGVLSVIAITVWSLSKGAASLLQNTETLTSVLLIYSCTPDVMCYTCVLLTAHFAGLKPSKTCGPFRGLTTIFEAISGWVAKLSTYPSSLWVVWIYHNIIESVHFFFILSIIVLIITYLYWQIIDGRKIMVKLLQEQIINEGKDKMFLLKKLHALQASKPANQAEKPQPAGIFETTNFSHVTQEEHHPGRNVGSSAALALALRARQEAEWEMEEESNS